jgi:FKBP-type peptidyl-prolyl cis-trans isomerase
VKLHRVARPQVLRPVLRGAATLATAFAISTGTGPGWSQTAANAAAANPKVSGNGPMVNEHVHAAFGIFVCDKYLPIIDGSRFPDPDGIHTHDDGLIHAHPFTLEAAGKNAILGRFLDVIETKVEPGKSLTVKPIDLSMKEGAACPAKSGKAATKANIRVLLWATSKSKTPVEVPDPKNLPIRQDQVIAFVAAPAGVIPPMPPSLGNLQEPGDVALALPLTPKQKAARGKQPTVKFPTGTAPTTLQITTLTPGSGQPVKVGDLVAIDLALGGFANKKIVESSWQYDEPTVFRVGRGRFLQGVEQAIIGMKEGQVVQAVIPPDLGFGNQDPGGGLGRNATLVVVIRLAARQAGPAQTA